MSENLSEIVYGTVYLFEQFFVVDIENGEYSRIDKQANIGLISQVIFQFMFASISAIYVIILIFKHVRNVEEMERSRAIVQLNMEKERAERMEQHSWLRKNKKRIFVRDMPLSVVC